MTSPVVAGRKPSIVVDPSRPAHHTLVPPERDVLTGRLTSIDREDKGLWRPDHDDAGPHLAEHAPSGLPAAASPPELDAARVTGHPMTATRTAAEVGPGVEISPEDAVGAVRQTGWTCDEGSAPAGGGSCRSAPPRSPRRSRYRR